MTIEQTRAALIALLTSSPDWKRAVGSYTGSEYETARVTIDMLFEHLGVKEVRSELLVSERAEEVGIQHIREQQRRALASEVARACEPELTVMARSEHEKMVGVRRYRASILAITKAPEGQA